jgi:MFS family permease
VRDLNRNVWLLAIASALGLCSAPLVVFVGGLVGSNLAEDKSLATLPVAAIVIGTACAVIPVARLMQTFGKRRIFLLNILMMAIASSLASLAIYLSSFVGFCVAVALLGMGLAGIQQYRFAAMESVPAHQHAPAASFVLLGGLVAAFLGPELGQQGRFLLDGEFSGAFLLLSLVLLASVPVLAIYKPVKANLEQGAKSRPQRSLREIASQPVFWLAVLSSAIAYSVMSYVMTATPVSMHKLMGHSVEDTKWVIQIHIMAMYLPSFFSGILIQRWGQVRMMWLGLASYVLCLILAWLDTGLVNFYASLILLGIGWNLLFVSGTSLLPQSYREGEAIKVQGVNDFTVFGLQAVAALSSGVVVYQFGWELLLFSAVPVLCIQLALLLFWGKEKQRQPSF